MHILGKKRFHEKRIGKLVQQYSNIKDYDCGFCRDSHDWISVSNRFLDKVRNSDIEVLLTLIAKKAKEVTKDGNSSFMKGIGYLFVQLIRWKNPSENIKELISQMIIDFKPEKILASRELEDGLFFVMTKEHLPHSLNDAKKYFGKLGADTVTLLTYLVNRRVDETVDSLLSALENRSANAEAIDILYKTRDKTARDYLRELMSKKDCHYGEQVIKTFAENGNKEALPYLMLLCKEGSYTMYDSDRNIQGMGYKEILILLKQLSADHYKEAVNFYIQKSFKYGCPVHENCRGRLIPSADYSRWTCSEDDEVYKFYIGEHYPFLGLMPNNSNKPIFMLPGLCHECKEISSYDGTDIMYGQIIVCRNCGDIRHRG